MQAHAARVRAELHAARADEHVLVSEAKEKIEKLLLRSVDVHGDRSFIKEGVGLAAGALALEGRDGSDRDAAQGRLRVYLLRKSKRSFLGGNLGALLLEFLELFLVGRFLGDLRLVILKLDRGILGPLLVLGPFAELGNHEPEIQHDKDDDANNHHQPALGRGQVQFVKDTAHSVVSVRLRSQEKFQFSIVWPG